MGQPPHFLLSYVRSSVFDVNWSHSYINFHSWTLQLKAPLPPVLNRINPPHFLLSYVVLSLMLIASHNYINFHSWTIQLKTPLPVLNGTTPTFFVQLRMLCSWNRMNPVCDWSKPYKCFLSASTYVYKYRANSTRSYNPKTWFWRLSLTCV